MTILLVAIGMPDGENYSNPLIRGALIQEVIDASPGH
jgi:hypothetical protein